MTKLEVLAEREFFAWWKRGAMRYLDSPETIFWDAFLLGYAARKREEATKPSIAQQKAVKAKETAKKRKPRGWEVVFWNKATSQWMVSCCMEGGAVRMDKSEAMDHLPPAPIIFHYAIRKVGSKMQPIGPHGYSVYPQGIP